MNAVRHAQAVPAFSRRSADFLPAEQRSAAEFIPIIAHELRNPLGPLKNVAALLMRTDLDIPAIRLASRIIDRQVSAMTLLIDDLLNAPRFPTGKFQLWRTPIALSEILERALETACPIVVERGHTLVVKVPAQPIVLNADVMRLSQVLHNLIVNAAKYTNSGGQIWVDVRRDGNTAVLVVGDTGIGIAPAQIDAIFDLYTQVATDRAAGGIGIGLYVARSLVEAHGGTLRVVSQGAGLGSEFIVRLPCSPPFNLPADEEKRVDIEQLQVWEGEGGSRERTVGRVPLRRMNRA